MKKGYPKMKKLLCLLLALAMLFAFAACTEKPADDTGDSSSESTTESTESTDASSETPVVDAKPVNYFSISMGNGPEILSLVAQDNGDGTVFVECNGDGRKKGNLDASVLEGLAAALAQSGLPALNEQSVYEEGDAYANLYVAYTDETYLMADFGGTIPQEFTDGYNAMASYFQTITAEMPDYVPQPEVMGEVDETVLNALMDIMNASGINDLDTYAISDVALDENFGAMTGLSGSQGIANGTTCNAMMMTTPYSLTVVTVEEGTDVNTICQDFAANMAWQKWVCVAPESALIATKDNMVLCLMGSETLFSGTADAIEVAGWTVDTTMDNPIA